MSRDWVVGGHPKPIVISDPNWPITYILWAQGLRFVAENFLSLVKIGCKSSVFANKGFTLNVKFLFSNFKRHILRGTALFDEFCMKISSETQGVGRTRKKTK